MKKVFAIIALSFLWSANAIASEFCSGFKQGYIAGYKQARNTGMSPMTPMCPMQPMKGYGDPKSNFEHGYIIGLKRGMRG